MCRACATAPRVSIVAQHLDAMPYDEMKTPLRQRYEAEVHALRELRGELEARGTDVEQIARELHGRRRAIGLRYKLRTPVFGRRGQLAIYRRNVRKYGNLLGPSIEWLRLRGRTWEEICESACRADGRDLL